MDNETIKTGVYDTVVTLGGDNKMQNSPAEIYANVRNRALDEAAALLEGWDCPYAAIAAVRALKTPGAA